MVPLWQKSMDFLKIEQNLKILAEMLFNPSLDYYIMIQSGRLAQLNR